LYPTALEHLARYVEVVRGRHPKLPEHVFDCCLRQPTKTAAQKVVSKWLEEQRVLEGRERR